MKYNAEKHNSNRCIHTPISTYLLVILLSFSNQIYALAAANIKISTVPDILYENQSFNLIYQTYQAVDGAPDFSPLEKNFTIVRQTQRNNFKIFSGDFQRSDNWVLELIPDKAGIIFIPAIAFGKDHSPSIELSIKANAATNNHQFISELDVSSTEVYVGSQIIITERMLSTKHTARPSFSDLKINGVDFMLERLDESQTFDIKRGDTLYHVIEIHYALYPQQAGTLTILPSIAVAQVAASGDGSINPLMNNSITKQAASAPVSIKVNPIPAGFTNNNWLPANHVSLTEEWPESNSLSQAGEPLTRHLTITVEGQGHTTIPALPITPVDNLKRYSDNPVKRDAKSATGITGSRDTLIVLIPTQAGNYQLPAIEVPWWNMKDNTFSVATIPPRNITIGGTPITMKLDVTDTSTAVTDNSELVAAKEKARLYLWIITFIAMVCASILLMKFERYRAKKRLQKQVTKPRLQSLSSTEKSLEYACQNGKEKACEKALLAWANALFVDTEISNLGALYPYLDEPLKTEIAKLEAYLYGAKKGEWSPDNIWQASRQFAALHTKQTVSADAIETDIEPLHRMN